MHSRSTLFARPQRLSAEGAHHGGHSVQPGAAPEFVQPIEMQAPILPQGFQGYIDADLVAELEAIGRGHGRAEDAQGHPVEVVRLGEGRPRQAVEAVPSLSSSSRARSAGPGTLRFLGVHQQVPSKSTAGGNPPSSFTHRGSRPCWRDSSATGVQRVLMHAASCS